MLNMSTSVQNPMITAEKVGNTIEELTDNLTASGKEILSAGKGVATDAREGRNNRSRWS